MSRDSRLLHNHLHALQEHLNAGHAELAAAAGDVHQELDAARALPIPDEYRPPVIDLPPEPDATVDN